MHALNIVSSATFGSGPPHPRGGAVQLALAAAIFAAVLLLVAPVASAQATIRPVESANAAVRSPAADSELSLIERLADVVAENNRLRLADADADENAKGDSTSDLLAGPQRWLSPEGLSGSLQVLLLLTVLSLAPAILLMTTCYVRIIVVLGLLRQAMGSGQLPPSQVITSIAMFVTLFVMTPVWNEVYQQSIKPYGDPQSGMTAQEAWERGSAPVRRFMASQIAMAGNYDDVHLFYSKFKPSEAAPEHLDEVPLQVLLPAYMLSELKTAFIMGFAIYLPFLILDLIIASITISMGMMMLPPAIISTPFKLLLFVLVDGWHLVVHMLIDSFGTYGT